MKIAVYSPAKNEEKNAAAWARSCVDADYRIVTDTGSSDNTKKILQEEGVTVYDTFVSPWRFDDAYNIAMSLCPADADVCICLHMDERLDEGWREKLEKAWTPETTRLRYTYIWNWNPDGTPGRQWSGDRIHARKGHRWMGATHEGLCARYGVKEHHTFCDDLRILHYPDIKDKSHDLGLLQEATHEMPHDSRMRAYLGREYFYKGDMEQSAKTYKEFLSMSWDKVERGQAMINLSTAEPDDKVFWLKMAALETPGHREPLTNLAQHYYNTQDWTNCYKYATNALKITVHPMDYTCTPEAWGYLPHDLASIAAWNLGMYKESLEQAELALSRNPNDDRLKNNLKLIKEFMEEKLTNE